MQNLSIGSKRIILLLGVLLLAGVLVAAFSINGGNLLTANPVSAQPQQNALDQNVVPVTGSSYDLETVDQPFQESEYGCHHDSADAVLNPEGW